MKRRKEMFNAQEVHKAYERISPYIRKTPLEESFYLGSEDIFSN